jgi:phosphosulfolactate synthase
MTDYPFAFVPLPSERSTEKPRSNGRTMFIDWGLDMARVEGLMRLGGDYVDIVKIPIGTSRLYDEGLLREKFEVYHRHGVLTYVGGGFIEHMYAIEGMKSLGRMFEESKRVGFDILEISDNYIPLDKDERQNQIRMAIQQGLTVYGEVGSKHEKTDAETLIRQADECFEAGAECVVLEGAELVENGEINGQLLGRITAGLDLAKAMIEVPGPWVSGVTWSMVYDLTKLLIKEVGPDVNLGNIMPDDIVHTEALRVGLGVVQPTVKTAAD